LVRRTAPLPAADGSELPTVFVATTYANTLEPQTKLNGEAIKVETGIVQLVAAIIDVFEPSQLVNSVVKVDPTPWRIVTV